MGETDILDDLFQLLFDTRLSLDLYPDGKWVLQDFDTFRAVGQGTGQLRMTILQLMMNPHNSRYS